MYEAKIEDDQAVKGDRLLLADSGRIEAFKRVEAGLIVPELCRELGISTGTFYKWRSKFGGMDTSLMARMKELEEENLWLRKMYVEEKLKAEVVTEARASKGQVMSATRATSNRSPDKLLVWLRVAGRLRRTLFGNA